MTARRVYVATQHPVTIRSATVSWRGLIVFIRLTVYYSAVDRASGRPCRLSWRHLRVVTKKNARMKAGIAGRRPAPRVLKGQAKAQLQSPWRIARATDHLHAVGIHGVRVAGMIEHIEKVRIEPDVDSLVDRDDLE